jgi:hypothetical protein
MFFNSKKIRFFPTISGLENTMPVIEKTGTNKSNWKKRASSDFIEKHLNLSVSRCLGINLFDSQGWIIRSWQDIIIETNGDGESFSWETPIDQKLLNNEDYVSSHNKEFFSDYFQEWPENTLKTIIKLNTSWRCVIPKNYLLLQLPIFYSDQTNFTALPGCYSSEYGIANLNIPVYWYRLNHRIHIPAGTPLANYILLKQEKINCIIDQKDEKLDNVNLIVSSNKFKRNYQEIKNFWKSYF